MSITPNVARTASSILLVLLWVGTIAWLRSGRSPAAIAGVLLSAFLIYPLYAMITPGGGGEGAARAAQGGLVGIVFLLGLMILMLIVGVVLHRPGLVWTAFIFSLIPVFAVSCGSIVYLVGLCLKKPAA